MYTGNRIEGSNPSLSAIHSEFVPHTRKSVICLGYVFFVLVGEGDFLRSPILGRFFSLYEMILWATFP